MSEETAKAVIAEADQRWGAPCSRCRGTGRERDGLDVDGKSWPCGLCKGGGDLARRAGAQMKEPFRISDDCLEKCLAVLRNSGIDTECGACMEVAFTGVTTNQHECWEATPTAPPAAETGLIVKALEALRDKWRAEACEPDPHPLSGGPWEAGREVALEECADDLDALLHGAGHQPDNHPNHCLCDNCICGGCGDRKHVGKCQRRSRHDTRDGDK